MDAQEFAVATDSIRRRAKEEAFPKDYLSISVVTTS
jgi:hypothetical protein